MSKIRSEFTVHRLNESGMAAAAQIAEVFSTCLDEVEKIAGQSQSNARELAIVRTKLQEACFYAKRAMALHPAHHDPINPEITGA